MTSGNLESEIERSRLEAISLADEDLMLSPINLARYRHVSEGAMQPLRYAYHLLGGVEGKRVLDYGCGSGENSVILAALGAEVTGIDISPELIDLARKRMGVNRTHWNVRVASAYATGESDDSFDIVLGAAILHHLDLEESSREVHRVLKPNGVAVFSEPVRDLAFLRLLRRVVPFAIQNASEGEYPLSREKIQCFCARFETVTSRRFSSPWGRLMSRLGYEQHGWIDRADRWFNERVTGALAAMEVFKVRKIAPRGLVRSAASVEA